MTNFLGLGFVGYCCCGGETCCCVRFDSVVHILFVFVVGFWFNCCGLLILLWCLFGCIWFACLVFDFSCCWSCHCCGCLLGGYCLVLLWASDLCC